MLNSVILAGRLTADPEMRYTPQGTATATWRLAVDRDFKNAQGQREADFIPCVAWRQTAELAANHLTKGRLITVQGRLQIRQYTTEGGDKRSFTEVVVDRFHFMDRGKEASEGGRPDVPAQLPDDLPF